ncbi:monovalent cation:proton antiporter-2 (CPA2) family protein [Luteimonas sp. e5]
MHDGGLELTLVFLLAAVVAVPVFKRFGLGAVLAYLVAGVLLGPYALRLVPNPEPVLIASEIGVVMMLFVIGLELSLPRLKLMRRAVFGVGALQVAVSALILGLVVWAWGMGGKGAIIVGLGLALSSTAVGLQILAERHELQSPHGRLGFAILLFQDLAAIPLMAAIPLLGSVTVAEADAVGLLLLKGLGAMALLIIGGRLLLRHLFRMVARAGIPEVFTAAALLVVLGSAWLMQLAGLSAGLGAFLAGVLLADSEFRHELESQIQPFEGLLLGLFFMSVGMSINLRQVLAEPGLVAAGVVVLMAIKFAVLYAIGMRPGRLDRRGALMLAALLALGGEFAFVVFSEAHRAQLISAVEQAELTAIVGLSMAATPLLVIAVRRLMGEHVGAGPPREFDTLPSDAPQVMIAGFGRFGQIVARLILSQRIRFVAIDPDVEQVEFFRRFGSPIYYGDPSKPELMRAAGVDKIKVFVVAVDDVENSLRIVRLIKRMRPDAVVFARARDRMHAWRLMDFGVKVIRETFGSSLEMGEAVLVALGLPREAAHERTQRFRAHDERVLRAQHLIYDDEDALQQSTHEARRELEELFASDLGEGPLSDAALDSEQGGTPTPPA